MGVDLGWSSMMKRLRTIDLEHKNPTEPQKTEKDVNVLDLFTVL